MAEFLVFISVCVRHPLSCHCTSKRILAQYSSLLFFGYLSSGVCSFWMLRTYFHLAPFGIFKYWGHKCLRIAFAWKHDHRRGKFPSSTEELVHNCIELPLAGKYSNCIQNNKYIYIWQCLQLQEEFLLFPSILSMYILISSTARAAWVSPRHSIQDANQHIGAYKLLPGEIPTTAWNSIWQFLVQSVECFATKEGASNIHCRPVQCFKLR